MGNPESRPSCPQDQVTSKIEPTPIGETTVYSWTCSDSSCYIKGLGVKSNIPIIVESARTRNIERCPLNQPPGDNLQAEQPAPPPKPKKRFFGR